MSDTTVAAPDLKQGQARNLALATPAFAISFWAWNLIAPLGVQPGDAWTFRGRPRHRPDFVPVGDRAAPAAPRSNRPGVFR